MERWKDGKMEEWNNGRLGRVKNVMQYEGQRAESKEQRAKDLREANV